MKQENQNNSESKEFIGMVSCNICRKNIYEGKHPDTRSADSIRNFIQIALLLHPQCGIFKTDASNFDVVIVSK